jgi:hypothetical protein
VRIIGLAGGVHRPFGRDPSQGHRRGCGGEPLPGDLVDPGQGSGRPFVLGRCLVGRVGVGEQPRKHPAQHRVGGRRAVPDRPGRARQTPMRATLDGHSAIAGRGSGGPDAMSPPPGARASRLIGRRRCARFLVRQPENSFAPWSLERHGRRHSAGRPTRGCRFLRANLDQLRHRRATPRQPSLTPA